MLMVLVGVGVSVFCVFLKSNSCFLVYVGVWVGGRVVDSILIVLARDSFIWV